MPIVHKSYKFRLRPTPSQSKTMSRFAGSRRFIWNWGLARRKEYYAEHGRIIPSSQLSAELTALKRQPETSWLAESHAQLLQQTLRDLDRAFCVFFSGSRRFPKFKSKKSDRQRFRIPQRVKIVGSHIRIPKIGLVRIFLSQPVDFPIKNATFSRDATGKWFVSLATTFDMPDVPLPPASPDDAVGIDLGLKDFVTLSTGERVPSPRFYRKSKRKLRRLQRVLSRRKNGSGRRKKAKLAVAKHHQKISNKRKDFLHKLSTSIIRRFGVVCVEDLSIKGLARTKLSMSFNDAALGEFLRQLEYKSTWNRKHFAQVNRFFPSTKMCGGCGAINDSLTLSDRTWECGCGLKHDRDLNASRNILKEGLRMLAEGHSDSQNARGARRRPATAGIGQ